MPHSGRSVNITQYRQTQHKVGSSHRWSNGIKTDLVENVETPRADCQSAVACQAAPQLAPPPSSEERRLRRHPCHLWHNSLVPYRSSLAAMVSMVRDGAISPLELVDAHLRQIARRNPSINAFVTVLADPARETARALERSDPRGLLH